jgi:hypothetical protein
VARGDEWTNYRQTAGATLDRFSVGDGERHGEPGRTLTTSFTSALVGGTDDDTNRLTSDDSEAGALLAGRLPIQQRGITGTGLRAFHQQMRRQACNVTAFNVLAASRQPKFRLAVFATGSDPRRCWHGRGRPRVHHYP